MRFGIANSALWATATTAASNGSVNSMHDSFTPLGGLVPLFLIQLGEVIFGGVGSGLYGMLIFAIVAVFIAGPDGRPHARVPRQEDRGLRDEDGLARHPDPAAASCSSAPRSRVVTAGRARRASPTPARTASARSSTPSRSAWATTTAAPSPGLGANTPFYNTAAAASRCSSPASGSRSRRSRSPARWRARRSCPPSAGTLPTHTPLFVALLVGVVLIVGALTFIPALALGPIVEHLHADRR